MSKNNKMVFGGFEFQRADQSKSKKRKSNYPSFQSAKRQVSSKMFESASNLCKPKKNIKADDDVIILKEEKVVKEFPIEVWENIACTLSIIDIISLSQTNKRMYDIINQPEYMKYKKLYFKYLKGYITAEDNKEVKDVIEGKQDSVNWINYCAQCVPRYTVKSDFVQVIKKIEIYEAVCKLLKSTEDIWKILTYIIMFSDGMNKILYILTKLSSTSIHLPILLNYFYNLAFHSLVLLRNCHVDNNIHIIHYNIYYAIYMFENEFQATIDDLSLAYSHSGQQTITKYASSSSKLRLTHEQLQICSFNPDRGLMAKIIAFAGTGKTTTLLRYTQLRPNLSFLLIVFNKGVAEHAKTLFPKNVEVKTGHAIAYRHTGFRYAKKLTFGSIRVQDILDAVPARKGFSIFVRAKWISETLHAFFASDDERITTEHIPTHVTNVDPENGKCVTEEDKHNLVYDADLYWKKMLDIDDYSCKMNHDGYMKAWQLQKPRLNRYDVILVDEAQDSTPCLLKVITDQTIPAKILVGDPHQQIYSFRGAINALGIINAHKTFYLTQSFRFGSEIAYAAHCCLYSLKNVRQKILVGGSQICSIRSPNSDELAISELQHSYNPTDMEFVTNPKAKRTILCRYNFTVFDIATKLVYDCERPTVSILGGLQNFGLDVIEDIYLLTLPADVRRERREIRHGLIKRFESFFEFEKFAIKVSDADLIGKIQIVKRNYAELPKHLANLKQYAHYSEKNADIIIGTVHKAKGLEFNCVEVNEDLSLDDGDVTNDDINLLYVAITRGKKQLILPRYVKSLLISMGFCGICPIPPNKLDIKETTTYADTGNVVRDVNNLPFVLLRKPDKDFVGGIITYNNDIATSCFGSLFAS
ncbi:DgyrCDS10442 [Dimorphilus gyrociliatus]|uniref:DgyrCDS10442 n=1 Tax=Dimorphilus gyrociliatus TaxID=2664684 RepID=A0A7I8W066_9ANNE|nr:DgyrCDS10442 [Dimorphilus gyrociliatus]